MLTKSVKINEAKKVEIVESEVIKTEATDQIVRVTRGGICGSDVHYYLEGGIGDFKLQHPMTLGHEVVGIIPETEQPVAINPSRPCNKCSDCLSGHSNQCKNMRFFGSAMLNPHVDGGFSEFVAVSAQQIVPYDSSIDPQIMAFSEPLSVAIHAVNQAGSLVGKKVLVTGAGPIGALVIAVCKNVGAVEVVASDIQESCRESAEKMGATSVINPLDTNSKYIEDKGYFDVCWVIQIHP